MPINADAVRRCLQAFDFKTLFTQELGWDKHVANLSVAVDGKTYNLRAIAEKRGLQVFECPTGDGDFPDYPLRRKIERQVAKLAHEHLIVYTDAAKITQKWQWVRREPGRPIVCREFEKGQTAEALVQRLENLAVSLDEEEKINVVEVGRRTRAAFDVDRVTKRFYERFKIEHDRFLEFIEGIAEKADQEWYASLMLNRLMFVYFIQKKGFLDGARDYLRNRLRKVQELKGKDKFLTFYRHFLMRLFHEGLGSPKVDRKWQKDFVALVGDVPYLNGGLFEEHQLEKDNRDIKIKDDAFERLFDFFDQYQWHLDDRPLHKDDEINPDVLGYIFEKYINQKQMGAYYTKEDITGYIARNTIIPFLFNAAEKDCAAAFRLPSPSGRGAGGEGMKPSAGIHVDDLPLLWRLLADDPNRYIHDAVGHSIFADARQTPPRQLKEPFPLPKDIAAGIEDVSKRTGWNKPAPPEFALPTETWREVVARRQRCEELQAKLEAGEVQDINDLITLNLDIQQFAQDVVANCEGSDLLKAFWEAIQHVSVLDPTCGSGAFLFAALNVLEPLYDACLARMRGFLEDLERSQRKHHPATFDLFRKVLAEADDRKRHPSPRYYVLKSIILNNLYGVDIMEEAVEICKLRLFLNLVAQVETAQQVEPLPDIDFNIRAGNTLVGFATLDEVRKSLLKMVNKSEAYVPLPGMGDNEDVEEIVAAARTVDNAFRMFHHIQTVTGLSGSALSNNKQELRNKLTQLDDKLDRYIAGEYGINPKKVNEFANWRKSHQPFHWFAEFFGIMSRGGFDVIIGNPPYVELSALTGYQLVGFGCVDAGNLYAVVLERCGKLSSTNGRQGFIVPVSSVSTDRYVSLQRLLVRRRLHYSSFDDRPSRLFDGLEHIRLTVHLLGTPVSTGALALASTKYNK